ncbi:MAG: SDR family NAD(P)-dependent oxidoreductase, partial [Cyanobacteria bacterium P01_F01_bin.3]
QKGGKVIATARSLDSLQELEAAGMTTLALDVTDTAAISRAVDAAIATHQRIDILVNNAGYGQFGPLVDLSLEKLQAQFQTNTFAAIALIQQIAPIMKRQQSGLIVNIGSVSGIVTTPFAGAYCASKAALHSLSEALRLELSPFGITVVTVQPGAIRSNIGAAAKEALAGVVAPESWYVPYRETIEQRATLSQVNSTPTEQFAAQLVHQVMRPGPPAVIRLGNKSRWLPFLRKWLPTNVLEGILKRRFNLE